MDATLFGSRSLINNPGDLVIENGPHKITRGRVSTIGCPTKQKFCKFCIFLYISVYFCISIACCCLFKSIINSAQPNRYTKNSLFADPVLSLERSFIITWLVINAVIQGCHFWTQKESNWPQMRHIRYFSDQISEPKCNKIWSEKASDLFY